MYANAENETLTEWNRNNIEKIKKAHSNGIFSATLN